MIKNDWRTKTNEWQKNKECRTEHIRLKKMIDEHIYTADTKMINEQQQMTGKT